MKACDVPVGCIFSYKGGEYLVIYPNDVWNETYGERVCCLVLKPLHHPDAIEELHLAPFSHNTEVTLI